MKFLVTYSIHPDKRHQALQAFSRMTQADDLADIGKQITVIGRWHIVDGGSGLAIVETSDAQALARWALNWNHIMDLEMKPVIDDQEARSIGIQKFK
ncbi:DUF3303 domain-containing protein [Candidatus Nitronereus thalassa]|uniref:DUF3303 family protein n=1 Tax=Candidatus Nitronereus thalassa TaxID=3020898 RepID=A0ABU3K4K5_9BACT|nr:DUF3303 family protein [Candidatus Nitronereus thalassa]MDT7041337.1 DUF3303 family protein [Candidatus Nitronereus thalassa]